MEQPGEGTLSLRAALAAGNAAACCSASVTQQQVPQRQGNPQSSCQLCLPLAILSAVSVQPLCWALFKALPSPTPLIFITCGPTLTPSCCPALLHTCSSSASSASSSRPPADAVPRAQPGQPVWRRQQHRHGARAQQQQPGGGGSARRGGTPLVRCAGHCAGAESKRTGLRAALLVCHITILSAQQRLLPLQIRYSAGFGSLCQQDFSNTQRARSDTLKAVC